MRSARLESLVERTRSSLWALPTASVLVAVVAGVALSRITVAPDSGVGRLLFQGGPDGARSMLSSIAGSVMTVTSLTFSLTVITLQLASSQFSPRVLRTFLRDPINQVVLSVFLATFAYSLTVLRTIAVPGTGDPGTVVPQLAVTVDFVLALLSVAALVWFVNHVVSSIRVDAMMRAIDSETLHVLERVHPDEPEDADLTPEGEDVPVTARRSGFLLAVEATTLAGALAERGAVVAFDAVPGDQLVAGVPLGRAWRDDGSRLDDETRHEVCEVVDRHVQMGFERTSQQDVAYGLRQLTDIAIRALSPGTNDPTTAVHALGHMGGIVSKLALRPLGPVPHRDREGTVRVVQAQRDLDFYLELACAQTRRYGAAEPAVVKAIARLLRAVVLVVSDSDAPAPGRCADTALDSVRRQLAALHEDAEREVVSSYDRAQVKEVLDELDELVESVCRPGR